MFTIRKKFKFEAAHLLTKSQSIECQKIHGHSYIVEVFIQAEELNDDEMVVDFKIISRALQPIIDHWDHSLIVQTRTDMEKFSIKELAGMIFVDFNPTAEQMARHLTELAIFRLCDCGLKAIKIRIHETSTGWAEYQTEDFK